MGFQLDGNLLMPKDEVSRQPPTTCEELYDWRTFEQACMPLQTFNISGGPTCQFIYTKHLSAVKMFENKLEAYPSAAPAKTSPHCATQLLNCLRLR